MAQKININTTPGQFMPTLYYSQGDIGRTFELALVSSDGWTVPAGATVEMVATKPSGFGFTVSGTLADGVATFVTTETMTNEWGRFPAEIRITSGGVVIGTANFYLNGERNPHPEDTIDGDAATIIPQLTLLVERVETAASSVLDRQTVTTTLPAGTQATYSFDEGTNTQTFGIPQGEAGAGAVDVTASAYSSSKTYAVGDYVVHNSNLYRCTTAITTAESFTAGHWTQVVLADDVTDLKSALDYNHEENSFGAGFGLSNLNSSTGSEYWGNSFIYSKGYVESITVKTTRNTDVVFAFINGTSGTIFKKITAQNINGIQEVAVNEFIPVDFKLMTNGNSALAYGDAGNLYDSYYTSASLEVGQTPTFSQYGHFDFGIIVNYLTVGENLAKINTKLYGTRNKMFVFGDSITACYPTFNEDLKWQTEVARNLDVVVTSGAASGNGYLYSTGSGNAKTIAENTDFEQYDYAVAFWGTNDYGNDANLGTLEDVYENYSWHTSVYGAVAYVVRTIFASSQKTVPILVTPLNRTDRGTRDSRYAYGTPNGTGKTLSDYCQAIVDVANLYGIPYIDNRNSAFNMFSCESWLGDGLHPTDEGYKALGQWMSAQLSKYVQSYKG